MNIMKKLILIIFLIAPTVFAQLQFQVPLGKNKKPVSVLYVNADGSNNIIPIKTDSSGALDINMQDQITDPIIFKFNRIANSTTIVEESVINTYKIVVDDTTGIDNNTYVIMFNPITVRFYKGNVLSVVVDTLLMDTPLDSTFPIGSFVDFTSTNMNVDGSATIQTFGLRGVSESPLGISVDITKIILHCQTAGAIDLSKFGDILALTRGLVLRIRNGKSFNVFNIKTNGELASVMYTYTPYLATNPSHGVDGFLAKMQFAGQGEIGVAIRLEPGEDLEFLVQDNHEAIVLLEATCIGHIVDP